MGRLRALVTGPFGRFLLVGGSFSLIYSLTTAALIRLAATPAFATSVLVYICCIPLAFLSHKYFAFGEKTAATRAFVLYTAVQVISLTLVSLVTTRFITQWFWVNAGILLATSALAAVGSYLINRHVVFAAEAAQK